jgi:PAS domain S-box-containing protein
MEKKGKEQNLQVIVLIVGILIIILETDQIQQIIGIDFVRHFRHQIIGCSLIALAVYFYYRIHLLHKTLENEGRNRTDLEKSLQQSHLEGSLKMREQMFQSLFHENKICILLWNSITLEIVDANSAACQFYGWTHQELIQKKISDINTFSFQEVYDEMEKSLLEGCNHFHFKHRLSNGELRNVEVYSGTISHSPDNLIYSLIFDVTERDKFREQLQEIQERNEAMLKANPDVMVILNRDGVIQDYRSGENSFYSFKHDQHLNKNISEIFPQNLSQSIYSNMEKLFQTGQIQTFKYQWNSGGEIKYSIARLVLKGSGKALLIGSDITKLEQANERIKLQAHAMDAAFEGLSIHDGNGKFIYANKSLSWMHGYENSELIGKSWQILYDSDQLQRFHNEVTPLLFTRGKCVFRAVARKKDGSAFPQELSLTRLDNGYFVCTVHDISERIKVEQEQIDAKIKAEESDRLKSAFLANMSHEIRTPMNGIIGFAGLLKETELSKEEKEEYLNIILQSGERLLNIINDIVEISKIEAGMVEMKVIQTNINEQLDYICKFFRPEAEKKGIKLIWNQELAPEYSCTLTDKEKLYAVLINLVKNAIKYSHTGIIEIGCKNVDQFLEFQVKDEGIGIAEEIQSAVFNRFTQVELGNQRKYEGNGLGLSIAKAYIEMLGGKIWLKSKLGEGSTFYFNLPYVPVVNKNKESLLPKKPFQGLEDLTIMIVEDETVSRQLLTKLLEPFCSHILYADNGMDAVRICKNVPDLDIILMDIQLPKMDGFAATRLIREFNKQVIIIAQTALALSHNRDEAFQVGCNDYIPKPIRKEMLEHLLLDHLTNRKKVPETGSVLN